MRATPPCCLDLTTAHFFIPMFIDLSGLQRAATESPRSHGFSNAAVFSVPTVTERSKRVAGRSIETTPYRILDAPGLVDDYYLNLLDWTGPSVNIALGATVYSYDTATRAVEEAHTAPSGYVSCISGTPNGLLVGESSGRVVLIDPVKGASVAFTNHDTRVCAASATEHLLTTGDRTGRIISVDIRTGEIASVLNGHKGEICGLRWNNDLLASGSNDNTVRVWRSGSPVSKVLSGHGAAVKALAWCPWRPGILATGGGAGDRTLRLWDARDGTCLRTVPVASQVCSLLFLSRFKELITSHGFSDNNLVLWRTAGMKPVASFGIHEARVLHTALSPDQCTVVSLGADESLKFWKVADKAACPPKRDSIGLR